MTQYFIIYISHSFVGGKNFSHALSIIGPSCDCSTDYLWVKNIDRKFGNWLLAVWLI